MITSCRYHSWPCLAGPSAPELSGSGRWEVTLEDQEDLVGVGGHLVHEVAAVVIKPLCTQEPAPGLTLEDSHAWLEPVGEHGAAPSLYQRDAGDRVPGKDRAL